MSDSEPEFTVEPPQKVKGKGRPKKNAKEGKEGAGKGRKGRQVVAEGDVAATNKKKNKGPKPKKDA